MARLNKNAQKWVEALESGNYRQGQGYLCRIVKGRRRYCCLGLATQLYLKEHPDGLTVSKNKIDDNTQTIIYNGDRLLLPRVVAEWLGLVSTAGRCLVDGEHESLAALNDNGKSFKEIAKIIRSRPKELFRKRS